MIEEISWEKPHALEIIGSSFVGESKPITSGDLAHLNTIESKISTCSTEYCGSNAAAKHECPCKKIKESDLK
jgi:hypothetical protein